LNLLVQQVLQPVHWHQLCCCPQSCPHGKLHAQAVEQGPRRVGPHPACTS
jgi:hypothetical protein